MNTVTKYSRIDMQQETRPLETCMRMQIPRAYAMIDVIKHAVANDWFLTEFPWSHSITSALPHNIVSEN